MSGEEIKKILVSEGIGLSELAKMLGYDNDQRLHSKLKSDDVKSGIIEDIARVTNKNICLFYSYESNTTTKRNSTEVVSMPADVWAVISRQAESLKIKDAQTSELIDLLREQIMRSKNS